MSRGEKTLLRDFHQARWDEEFIMEMDAPGERGILVPGVEE
jgi:glycine dehydrogenase subunit 2